MSSPFLRIDIEAGLIRLAPGTGSEISSAFDRSALEGARLRWMELHSGFLLIGLPDATTATVEIDVPEIGSGQRKQRLIVYLDQNQWSLMGYALTGARPVPEPTVVAARWIADRVDAEEVILPLSAGRLVETGALSDERREAVANTLLRYSRGWRMRNPASVRRYEFAAALGSTARQPAVFSAEAGDTFATATSGPDRPLSWILALYNSMLERPAIVDGDAARKKNAWAEKWVPIAQALRAAGETREVIREVARENLVRDAADDVLRVVGELGLDHGESYRQLCTPGLLEQQPMLGLMAQVLATRLHNATQKPQAGDLFDFIYLPCAAAYADVLVAERRMISMLGGCRQPPAKAVLTTTLPQAASAIEALLSRQAA